MKALLITPLLVCVVAAACERMPAAPDGESLTRPASVARAADNLNPNFQLELILRPTDDGNAFGHVKFRQDNDDALRVDLDVWVRDLAPNTHYRLQRAVDTNIDDSCTSTAWLTLGLGSVPQDIVTDDQGTAKQPLFRTLATRGATFDIKMRIVTTDGVPVLASECYQFIVR